MQHTSRLLTLVWHVRICLVCLNKMASLATVKYPRSVFRAFVVSLSAGSMLVQSPFPGSLQVQGVLLFMLAYSGTRSSVVAYR